MAEKIEKYEADHVPSEMEDRIYNLIIHETDASYREIVNEILQMMDKLVEQNITDCDSCARVDPEDYCPEPQYDEGRI